MILISKIITTALIISSISAFAEKPSCLENNSCTFSEIPALVSALGKNEEYLTRIAAADTLKKFGLEAVPEMKLALKQKNFDGKDLIMEILGKIGPDSEIDIPIGSRVRMGQGGPNAFGYSSEFIQYQILDKELIDPLWFTKIGDL